MYNSKQDVNNTEQLCGIKTPALRYNISYRPESMGLNFFFLPAENDGGGILVITNARWKHSRTHNTIIELLSDRQIKRNLILSSSII